MRCMDKDAVWKATVCRQQVTGQGEHLTEKDVGSHSLVAVSGCCPGLIHKGGTKDADSCGSDGGGLQEKIRLADLGLLTFLVANHQVCQTLQC